MNTFLVIKQQYSNFSAVEKKIANYILENGETILDLSVQSMALLVGTSPAALVRFSRKIGLDGFSQLKQKISASLATMDNPTDFEEVKKGEGLDSIKGKIGIRMYNMIEQTNDVITDESINNVTKLIDQANTIFVFGVGASSLVAQDIFQKFTRIGKYIFFSQDIHHLSTSMVALKNKSLLILISNSGETKDLLRLSEVAQENQIKLVVITSNSKSSLAKRATEVLLSTSGDTFVIRTAATMSLLAQLYSVDILFYSYLSNYYNDGVAGIQKTRNAIKNLNGINKKQEK